MTEKRFTTRNGVFYTDTKTGYEFQCYGEVVDIMNELADENEQLKRSIECQNETIKEQCMKIDWASECGVKWEKEFKEWKGVE